MTLDEFKVWLDGFMAGAPPCSAGGAWSPNSHEWKIILDKLATVEAKPKGIDPKLAAEFSDAAVQGQRAQDIANMKAYYATPEAKPMLDAFGKPVVFTGGPVKGFDYMTGKWEKDSNIANGMPSDSDIEWAEDTYKRQARYGNVPACDVSRASKIMAMLHLHQRPTLVSSQVIE